MDAALSALHLESLKARVADLCADHTNLPHELNDVLQGVLHELGTSIDRLQHARQEIGDRNRQLNAAYTSAESERKHYHELFAFAPDGYLTTDSAGRVQELNHAAEKMFSTDAADPADHPALAGRPLRDFITQPERPRFDELIDAMHHGRCLADAEFTMHRPRDGETFAAALRLAPVHDDAGQLAGFRWLVRDISDRREAERQIASYQAQLRALASDLTITEQRERRRLATELHDYMAQLLVVSRMKVVELDRMIRSPRGIRLAAEINDVLKEALKYTRTLIAELSPTILYDAGLPAAAQFLATQMQRHGLKVHVTQMENPPRLPDEVAIILYESLRELLINVHRHAGADTAQVTLDRHGDQFSVTVRDQGVGFDPAAGREDAAAAGKYGLFSVRERLEAIGGRFDLRAAPGEGACATLSVHVQEMEEPAAAAPSPVKLAIESASGKSPSQRRGRGKAIRILLVDDHELVREGLRSVIESQSGLEVVGEATNGEMAIDLARQLQPGVIVMDINMPRMNGIEATRRIKSEHPGVCVIGLSVHDDTEVAGAMKDAGATAFISKADATDHLCEAIRALEPLAV